MKQRKHILLITGFLLLCFYVQAQPILYKGGVKIIGEKTYVLEDPQNKLSPLEAYQHTDYKKGDRQVWNFDVSSSTFWMKFSVTNFDTTSRLFLDIGNPLLDTCELFYIENGEIVSSITYGSVFPFNNRKYKYPTFLFNLNADAGTTREYLLKIRSNEQMLIPLVITNNVGMTDAQNIKDIVTGGFIGVIIIMIVYNLFIFISIKDRNYLYYILYILFIGLTQITLSGYTYKLLFSNAPLMFNHSIILFPSLAGISAILFIRRFLDTKHEHRSWDRVLIAIGCFYFIAGLLRFFHMDRESSRITDIIALLASVFVYVLVIQLMIKRSRPAKFLFFAWTIFLGGLALFALKNLGILPYNDFTNYTLQFGVAAQVAILSIALADKINILQNETKMSQKLALEASRENEKIVREQNIILEQNVLERTKELKRSNENLQQTLTELKEAEAQLVESEKMASLGQLTAGIAHEINNPINFVTSNVGPLKRDITALQEMIQQIEAIGMQNISSDEKKKMIEDIKNDLDYDYMNTEIDYLLNGIKEGANRTSEIVKGLRVFSRLDEDDVKLADINECLDSTIVIANNMMDGKIAVEKHYGNLPLVECYPGKLNQVFLNVLTNAIHSIQERWKGEHNGKLTITTTSDEYDVHISIKDNGMGMTEETKKKLFEPFFTTKDVGVGTGLGLSITWNTIKKHSGQIKVNSELGDGAEFIFTIPVKYTEPQND